MSVKIIPKQVNLDQEGEYDEFHDFSNVLMYIHNPVLGIEGKQPYKTNPETMLMEKQDEDVDVTSVSFSMKFWASAQAKNKQKRSIDYVEEGNTVFEIDLSNESIEALFNRFCQDEQHGLNNFIWHCFEQNLYQ